MQRMPDGAVMNFGHLGGDVSLGQVDMHIGADRFTLAEDLPRPVNLSLERCLSSDKSHYLNSYRAQLTQASHPLADCPVRFEYRTLRPAEQEDELFRSITAQTGPDGFAYIHIPLYDQVGDIHFTYSIQAFFDGDPSANLTEAESPLLSVYALRPHRNTPHPYNAYFANGVLYLSPYLLQCWPNAVTLLSALTGAVSPWIEEESLPPGLVQALLEAHVLKRTGEGLRWIASVHATVPLAEVKPMPEEGEIYV